MKKNNDQLLRECIRTILVEQELNEDIMQGYGDSLAKVFLKPFKDAGTAIAGELSKTSTAAAAAIAKTGDAIYKMINPFYESNYEKVVQWEKDRLKVIEDDPVYQKAWATIGANAGNGGELAFLYDPVGFVAGNLVRKSPATAFKAFEIFLADVPGQQWRKWQTGDSKKQPRTRSQERIFDELMKSYEKKKDKSPKSESFRRHKKKRRLTEASLESTDLIEFIKTPKIRKAMSQNSLVKKMNKTTAGMGAESAAMIIAPFNKVLNVKSIEELEKVIGQKIDRSAIPDTDGGDASNNDAVILAKIKEKTRKDAIKMIGDHLGEIGLGKRPDHPYFKAMMNAIKSIVPAS
tara:strand:+ start:10410 stop:11453 length:1044 start_codon:yes stop_codon:yes gene_type:complete